MTEKEFRQKLKEGWIWIKENPYREIDMKMNDLYFKDFSTKNIKTKGNKAMGMKFGQAVEHAKLGGKVAREGWNGKGMFVFFGFPKVDVNTGSTGMGATSGDAAEHFGCKYQNTGCMNLKTAQNTIQVGWVASQSDMLADDWEDVS